MHAAHSLSLRSVLFAEFLAFAFGFAPEFIFPAQVGQAAVPPQLHFEYLDWQLRLFETGLANERGSSWL